MAHNVDATPMELGIPEDAAVADHPELDGVIDQTAEQVEGVDVESMPALKSLSRALPSERARVQAGLMKVAKNLPKEWAAAGEDGEISEELLENLDEDQFVAIFEDMEAIVFQMAENPDDMREWIISQKASSDALTFAFQRVSALVGN